ncbi:MAG: hypothetical protein AAB560_00255, partial [Patescibacteria group bacterium]
KSCNKKMPDPFFSPLFSFHPKLFARNLSRVAMTRHSGNDFSAKTRPLWKRRLFFDNLVSELQSGISG